MKYFIKNTLARMAKTIKEPIPTRAYVVILLLFGIAASSAMTVKSGSLANPFGSVSAKPTAPPVSTTLLMAGKLPGISIPVPIDQSTLNKMPRFIVKFRDNSSEFNNPTALKTSINAAANTVTTNQRSSPLSAYTDYRLSIGADLVRLNRLITLAESNSFLTTLRSNPAVEYAEIDRVAKSTMVPNDPNFNYQWSLRNAPYSSYVTDAWDNSNGAGMVVAVIDSGTTTHSDLSPNILPGYDFIYDPDQARDGDGRDSNTQDEGTWCNEIGKPQKYSGWHGTHVSGTIAAVANNSKGIAGVAYQAKILPVRALGKCGEGYTSDIIDAIVWASAGYVAGVPINSSASAQILNLSLGIADTSCSPAMQIAIDGAVKRGRLVIVAAGNENADVTTSSPANCKGVISVGSTDANGKRAIDSNYGNSLSLSAPGEGILSTSNPGNGPPLPGESYSTKFGTSMAAPLVSGTAALVWSKLKASCQANANADWVKEILLKTAIKTPNCPECGAGIVNAALAVKEAINSLKPVLGFRHSISGLGIDVSGDIYNCKGGLTQYVVNYGDGATSSGNTTNQFNSNHVYSLPGTYTITVTVLDNGNAVGTSSQSVYISGHDTT